MSDLRVRDKRTGEEKTVPPKVYEALRHKYTLLDGEDTYVYKKKGANQDVVPAEVKFHPPVVVQDGKEVPIQSSSDEETIDLSAEYEALSGKKPDGRWSAEKLKTKLAEIKSKNNEG